MNSQNKYLRANSIINYKENWTGGFIPPHLVMIPFDYPMCAIGPISFQTHGYVSKAHNSLTNKARHP